MTEIKNKLRIFSAVILALSTAATIFTSCAESTPEVPVETVIGTNGEILGVSVYTEEDKSETQTVLYEITTKKKSLFGGKKAEETTTAVNVISVRNDSSGITVIPRTQGESASRVRPTFSKETAQKSTLSSFSTAEKEEQKTKHIPVSYVPKSNVQKTTKKAVDPTVKQTQAPNNTTKKSVTNEKVNDAMNGISVVFKTESVEKGSSASVMIQGEAGKKYSIDFYVTPDTAANLSALEDKTADENGFVTWTFNVPMSCESGNRKIIVKENGSDKYAQTSINVK